MFFCCGYDPGYAAWLDATEGADPVACFGDDRLDAILGALSLASVGLCYALILMVA
jgi:hypothetical protein